MLRFFRWIAICVLLFIVCVAGFIFYSFKRTRPLEDRQQLSGGAVQIRDGIVSSVIIPSGDHLAILVDCGNDRTAKAVLNGLHSMGMDQGSVKTILITHGHPDHINGCGAFPNAELVAMAQEQPLMEGRAEAKSVIAKVMKAKDSGLHVARYLNDGDSFQSGNVKIEAFLIPGHTDGSAAYLAAGTLYLGDSADSGKQGNLLHAKHIVSNDVRQNRRSLDMLATRLAPRAGEIEYIAFAHSGPLLGLQPLLDFAEKDRKRR